MEQVAAPHLGSPVLRLQAARIAGIWPGREWPAGAIDPDCLSSHELWYATG